MTTTPQTLPFDAAARLPAPGDNVAIATRRLEAGAAITMRGTTMRLAHTVLEGHRFVVEPIDEGADLLSWGLPFGAATRALEPGEYVCNERILAALAVRDVGFELPAEANFSDRLERHVFDADAFRPGRQVEPVEEPGAFAGYRRAGGRGVGTRNHAVVLAVSSRANAFASAVARRFDGLGPDPERFDGVVAVTHTEGATGSVPHNLDYILRTLAGFMLHPNVGAVLAVDYPGPGYGIPELRDFMARRGDALSEVRHDFLTIEGDLETELDRAASIVRGWLPEVEGATRTDEPLSALKVALQCGGSDAFSGVSGNALAGWVAKLLIRHGGSAVIAETDELIGAEAYVLRNVRDLATAQRLLERIEAFKERVGHHGATAEGNPSGGNNYRGLYNIAIKSLGAARKFDPEVRLDRVIDYAEPMDQPGCTFMDSPGNDLESIAGQVAAGANLIFFTTGNGSITNFPFVPTLKFVTTSGRFRLLSDEMDVNAGRYNDGESMADLGDETFALARRVASGERTKGELAGHSQVQIWRDWPQVDASRLIQLRRVPTPDGRPLRSRPAAPSGLRYQAYETPLGPAVDQVGLIMPTSLCSGQVARIIAEGLGARRAEGAPIRRYVALVHTEGCGSANTNDLFLRTLLGHLRHRSVRHALLLEHGCEMTHNDAVRGYLADAGVDASRFGWASIQLDGGIGRVGRRVAEWFEGRRAEDEPLVETDAGAAALTIGLLGNGLLPDGAAASLADLSLGLLAAGGRVVVPSSGALAASEAFRERLLAPDERWRATLDYGERAEHPGLHVMDAPTDHPTETITGLGGTGVDLMIGHVGAFPMQAHPMVPLLQISGDPDTVARLGPDLDLVLQGETDALDDVVRLEQLISGVASRQHSPMLVAAGMTDFQLTRGRLGVSV